MQRCDPARPVLTLQGAALGTGWRVRFADARRGNPEHLCAAIEQRLAGIVAEMSQWEPASILSRFNRARAGAWFPLPPDFAKVIAAALRIADQTDGAFDPTFGRTAALLGFGAQPVEGRSSAAELDKARSFAGWRWLDYDPGARRLRQPGGLWLDLSGIAKGFAVDAVAALLAERGIADALVEIGGELVGKGLRPDRQPWWVDLECPPGLTLAPLRLGLHEAAVATSGNYVRGAHTIDPRTGKPLEPFIASVSVVHESAMLADGWATALTVLGANARAVAVREGLTARIVTQDGEEYVSPALAGMIAD